jgi:hypothetical protein
MARKPVEGSGRQAKGSPATLVWVEQAEAVTEALRPLDRIAVEMEGKWGAGRLTRLVTPEIAARFGSAKDKLNEAIRSNDGDEVAKRAAVLIRGWQALDKAATEAGCEALPLRTVGVKHEGRSYVVAWDRGDVHKAATLSDDPGRVVTVHELLVAWEAMRDRMNGEAVAEVKRAFPGAEVVRASIPRGGDELPF